MFFCYRGRLFHYRGSLFCFRGSSACYRESLFHSREIPGAYGGSFFHYRRMPFSYREMFDQYRGMFLPKREMLFHELALLFHERSMFLRYAHPRSTGRLKSPCGEPPKERHTAEAHSLRKHRTNYRHDLKSLPVNFLNPLEDPLPSHACPPRRTRMHSHSRGRR